MKNTNNLFIKNLNNQLIVENVETINESFILNQDEKLACFCLIFDDNCDLTIKLSGKNASCDVKCLYLGAQKQTPKINVKVIHQVGETYSKQTIKGVLADEAKSDFHGLISIGKDAQNCDGYQNHRALILSDNAIARAIPELEIYADDVKCAHGSAVGPLDKNALFYLMTRGINKEIAEKMLIESFLKEFINDEYISYSQPLIEEWLEENV